MPGQPRLPLWFLIVNWVLLLAAFVLGTMLGSRHSLPALPEPHAEAIARIHREILRSHVDPPTASQLLDRAIAGMVDDLDEYSRYIGPAELAQYLEGSTGRYEGLGMLVSQQGEELVLLFPFPGGPAEQSGVLPGDVVRAIDGKLVADLPLQNRSAAATDLIRGPAGSRVTVRLQRGADTFELAVPRAPVQRQTVKWAHLADAAAGIGYVHLTDFHQGGAAELSAAIEQLGGNKLCGLILDLRHNGGGSLDECVQIARLFLQHGTIVTLRRRGALLEEFTAEGSACAFPDLPLTLLVNGRSASASEVLAGALQDHGRAKVVGVRTFGKGFVNSVYSWPDLPLRLKLTTAHYFTPKGRNIDRPHQQGQAQAPNEGGIAPDVETLVNEAQATTIYRSLTAHETPPAYLQAHRAIAAKYGIEVAGPPSAERDPQLAAALATLQPR